MNTQNVKTAASESSKTGVKNLTQNWLATKTSSLADLAKLEGDLMMYQAFYRMDIESDDPEEEYITPAVAAGLVNWLEHIGGITSPAVYDLVKSVEQLALATNKSGWEHARQAETRTLAVYQAEAPFLRETFLKKLSDSLRPFSIEVTGRMEYPADDPFSPTYFNDGSVTLDRADTISEAMARVSEAWVKNDWNLREQGRDYYDPDLCRDGGPLSFFPQTVVIQDECKRVVLRGNASALAWYEHVTDPKEITLIEAEIKALNEEAAYESGWDNHETARQLRLKASLLGAGVVDKAWRGHPDVSEAVSTFVVPQHEDEEQYFANYLAEIEG